MSRFASNLPSLVRAAVAITALVWFLALVDIILLTNKIIAGVTVSGAALNLVTATYVFLTAYKSGSKMIQNPFLAYSSFLVILTMSGIVMILTHMSESQWETGGDQALERVKMVTLLLLLGNMSQFASLSFFFRSLHQDRVLCSISYRIQVDRRSSRI